MAKDKQKIAFTLIELLIAITIIFIFGGLSLAYYNNFTQEQRLKKEAKKFVDVLELAKKRTSANDYGNYFCSNGYRIDLSSNNYRLKICCDQTCLDQRLINTYTLPDNINFQQTNFLRFFPMSNRVENAPLTLTIKNLSINKCISITISQFGIITLNETLTSC